MEKNTLEEYKAAIRARYETEKNGTYSEFLIAPSPAKLRELCKLFCEKGLSADDEGIMIRFFGEPSSSLTKQISNFDIDRLKPIRNFLVKGSKLTALESINLAALLVCVENRPYLKYKASDNQTFEKSQLKGNANKELLARIDENSVGQSKRKKTITVAVIITAIAIFSGYGIKSKYFPAKECMEWRVDHYEEVLCDDAVNQFAATAESVPKNLKVMGEMKKIQPTAETVFFRHGKPVVWYCKQNRTVEFFTAAGNHPVSGKQLKPITQYMVKKYVLKN
ncbi:MAG TPA: hypothetical protein VGB43_04955 [Flavobacterium sp.]